MLEKLKNNKQKIIIGIIIIIGILIRIIGIDQFPNALNCDEASSGYEAYSILNYGIDRNGNHLPCFLISWGSGQNALLTYLIIPFIQVFGLNEMSIRLPMAILGGISVIIIYLLLKRISNKTISLIGVIFFVICPWHIMKSRWGLESNLFPDLILIFTYMLIKGLQDNNKILYYCSFIIAGITAYAYGTAYFFLPLFVIPLMIMLIRKKEITIKQAIISIGIVTLVSLPIILFLLINTFNLEQINLPFLTIPKSQVNRYQEITSIFSGDFLKISITNFLESIKMLIYQNDGLEWNSVKGSGIIYLFSGVFTIIGIIFAFVKNKEIEIKYNYIFNLWFIVSILLTIICEPNINRLNIMMIPLIYYTIIGIYIVINEKVKLVISLLVLYILSFGIFIYTYLNQNYNQYSTFESGLKEVVEYVSNLEDKEIHITRKIKEPYIYVLFYAKYNTTEFVNTVEYYNPNSEFRQVKKFGDYYFDDIKEIEINEKDVYVIKKQDRENYNLENARVKEFENYIVIEKE